MYGLYILFTLVFGILILVSDTSKAWEPHATIAKQSVAMSYYKSYKEFKEERNDYEIPDSVVEDICKNTYHSHTNFYFGDHLFTEIEINAMNSKGDYYDTIDVIPIPSNPIISKPMYFDSKEEKNFHIKRKENEFVCCDCNLFFNSERQLQRHQRTHRTKLPAPTIIENYPPEEMYHLQVVDGELELTKDEYDAISFYLKNPELMRKHTVELYIPSLLEMWLKNRQS